MNIKPNAVLAPHVKAFKSTGSLGPEAQRHELSPEAAAQVRNETIGQIDQVIQSDNTEADSNPEVGKVAQNDPEAEMSMTGEFVGDTTNGEAALTLNLEETASSAYAEFTSDGATIVQSISEGGEPGFVGIHLSNEGQSYIETLNVPEGYEIVTE